VSGPTAEQLAQFQKGTAFKFDPSSWVDRNKMHALMSGGANWADSAAARRAGSGQQYAWHNAMRKTAFAALEKSAGEGQLVRGLAGWVLKGLRGAGKAMSRSGDAAGASGAQRARQAIRDAGGIKAVGGREAAKAMQDAGRQSGNLRRSVGAYASQAGDRLASSSTAQNAINYGGAGLGVTGVGAGSYMLGNSRGNQQGRAKGLDEGIDAGIASAMSAAQNAGGGSFLDRLAHVFNSQSGLPNYGQIAAQVQSQKDDLIRALIAQRG
jgi:hypothetical protein